MKSRACLTLVQPHLLYAAETWNSYNITTADRLEHIHRAAACYINHDCRHATSVNNLINTLGWDHLHIRFLVSQLTMFYEIRYCLVNIHMPQLISPATFFSKHDPQLKYAIPVATIDSYRFSFYPCSIRLWNQLPSTAVFASSSAAFQTAALLAVVWMKLPIGTNMQ